jgi:hypothetical protein
MIGERVYWRAPMMGNRGTITKGPRSNEGQWLGERGEVRYCVLPDECSVGLWMTIRPEMLLPVLPSTSTLRPD